MKVTYNWLKDFVEIKLSAQALADKLTMAGLEVVALEEKAGDFIFEIEITSNRPDWLSIFGVAREIAVITGAKLKNPYRSLNTRQTASRITKSNFKVEIENKKDCPLYTARIMKNVKVGSSPEWLSKRLESVGCRSVNNVVDITNYVLFELGEPLHAFDLDKLSPGKIIVRRAKPQEKILTIDGIECKLFENNLVIADCNKAVAIAGVMGGKESEVSLSTKNILLEGAIFDPITIRRSRQASGRTSESSYRFERGVDLEVVGQASLRAAQLLQEYCGAQEVSFNVRGLNKTKIIQVELKMSGVSKILGINLTAAKIKQILTGLGFKIKQRSKNILNVTVPSFRQDVKQQVDLIEELARIFGYEQIPNTVPAIKPDLTSEVKRDLVSDIKNMLTGLGVTEAVTYSLIDRHGLTDTGLGFGEEPVEIMNPLSQEQEILRPTLMFGLGRAISFNLNQKQEHVLIFEIADIFKAEIGGAEEKLALGIALSGERSFFTGQGRVRDESGLLNLKGILETIFKRLGIIRYEFKSRSDCQIEIYVQEEKIGSLLKLSPRALDSLEIKNRDVFLGEIILDKLLGFVQRNKKFSPLPKYPAITRDISFILKDDISVKDMLVLLKEQGSPLLSEVKITDYYQGKQIPAGYRGLTLSCLYASGERTLTEKEIQPTHDSLCALLSRQFQVKLR